MLNQACRKLFPDETLVASVELLFPTLADQTPVMVEHSCWKALTDINNSPLSNQYPVKLAKSIITSTIMGGETQETVKPKSSYPVRSAHPVGQWIPDLYKSRIAQFYAGGQYEHNNLRA